MDRIHQRRRLPPLNALRAFEAAARHLNFSRAADELSVTPGAVSQQIQNLEDYVGAALFKRTPKGLLLTDAAQTALPALREAFDRLAEAASLLTAAVDGRRLTITAAALLRRQVAGAAPGRLRAGPSAGRRLAHRPAWSWWTSTPARWTWRIRYGSGRYPGLEVKRLVSEAVIPVLSPELVGETAAATRPRTWRATSCCTTARPRSTTAAPTGPCGWRRAACAASTATAARASTSPAW